jgi:hypothetical protein
MKTESYSFRDEELELLRNMSFDEYRELKTALSKCEEENEVFYKLLKERIVIGSVFFAFIIISICLFNLMACGVAILFFVHFVIKAIKTHSKISINNFVIKSLEEDIEYFNSL